MHRAAPLLRQRTENRLSGLGLLWACLALWVQLVTGSIAFPHISTTGFDAALDSAICHIDLPGTNDPAQQPHSNDCLLCPLCQLATQVQAVLPVYPPVLAAPFAMLRLSFLAPPPHSQVRTSASPNRARGPPQAV